MPVACSSSVTALTGQDGSLWFRPPGGSTTLDQSNFEGTLVFVGANSANLTIGMPVVFESAGPAGLPRSTPQVTLGTSYYVIAIDYPQPNSVQVSETPGGEPIVFHLQTRDFNSAIAECVTATGGDYDNSDVSNGVDSLCTDGPNYDGAAFDPGVAEYDNADVTPRWSFNAPGTAFPAATNVVVTTLPDVVCQVREFSAEVTREELDSTVLPCKFGSTKSKYAEFRTLQSGYAGLSGTATLLITEDQNTAANKMMKAVMDRVQTGASLKLYVSTVADATGVVDDSRSLLLEFPCAITGMSLAVTPDDLTTAEITFNATCQPTQLFGQL